MYVNRLHSTKGITSKRYYTTIVKDTYAILLQHALQTWLNLPIYLPQKSKADNPLVKKLACSPVFQGERCQMNAVMSQEQQQYSPGRAFMNY